MRTVFIIAAISISITPALAQQDPGIQDSLIIGSAHVDSSDNYQIANIPVYAVTDDSVTFVCIPVTWHPTGRVYIADVAYYGPFDCPGGDNYDTLFFDRNYFLIIGWTDAMHDTSNDCILYTYGQRLHVLTLQVVVPPNTPSGLVSFDTCWDVRNGGLAFGLIDGLTQISPGFQLGFIAIGPVGVDEGVGPPERVSLSQNYPNPFNARTAIRYNLPGRGEIKLEIYNIAGQRVAVLFEGMQEAGEHRVIWDAGDAASGIYFARLTNGTEINCIKMTLLR